MRAVIFFQLPNIILNLFQPQKAPRLESLSEPFFGIQLGTNWTPIETILFHNTLQGTFYQPTRDFHYKYPTPNRYPLGYQIGSNLEPFCYLFGNRIHQPG